MKIENIKQLFEDVFSVESIHSNKKRIIVHTDTFKEGLAIEKIAKNCAILYLNNHDYESKQNVSDGSIQIVFFPTTQKELNKRFKLIAEAIGKKE